MGRPMCDICRESLRTQTLVATLCGHVFHYQCLWQWTRQRDSCPHCRLVIRQDDLRKIYLSEQPEKPKHVPKGRTQAPPQRHEEDVSSAPSCSSSSTNSDPEWTPPVAEPASLLDLMLVLVSDVSSLGRVAAHRIKIKMLQLEDELRRGVGEAVRFGSSL